MKVLYCGSFSPFHSGHKYVYDIACKCFGKENVWLGIGVNKDKPNVNNNNIKFSLVPITNNVIVYEGLTANTVKEQGFDLLVRGIRVGESLDHEEKLMFWNRKIAGVETILIPTPPELNQVSSSAIRELSSCNESLYGYIDEDVFQRWNRDTSLFPTTVYFGRSCSGKSTYLKDNMFAVNMDVRIWDCVDASDHEILMFRKNISEAFRHRDMPKYFQYIDALARKINWNKFVKSGKYIDAAVIGVYWNYIPAAIRGSIRLVKIETSTANRIKFAGLRNVSDDFIESADYFYLDPPFWDETITIKDI